MSLYDDHVHGCSDGNCVWKRPEGMVTNGGCKCLYDLEWQTKHYDALSAEEKQDLRRQWSALKRNITIMRDTIEDLRSDA
jgi:hypothetical protein